MHMPLVPLHAFCEAADMMIRAVQDGHCRCLTSGCLHEMCAITLAAKRDRMPVPQPTSRTILSLNRNSFCMMAAW